LELKIPLSGVAVRDRSMRAFLAHNDNGEREAAPSLSLSLVLVGNKTLISSLSGVKRDYH
jgi:hypothetical protein